MSTTHRGRTQGGVVGTQDRRITDLILESMTTGLRSKPGKLLADPMRVMSLVDQDTTPSVVISLGRVVHSIPHLNWYRVQVQLAGYLGCCALQHHAGNPLGVRSGSPIPVDSQVLVYKPQHLNYGIIMGVLPPLLQTNIITRPDWLCQGGQSGIRREDAHQQPLRMLRAGGVLDFSNGSPMDATGLEATLITETGIAFLMDAFQMYMRVSEACGLWLNLYDGFTRLRGLNLDIESTGYSHQSRNDEGELIDYFGSSTYQWEALGAFAPNTAPFAEFDDKTVQYKEPVGKVDLDKGLRDSRPFHRYQEHGGYEGQGRLRMVVAPPTNSGFNTPDTEEHIGLFCESIGVDGNYSLRSAKGIYIGKRSNIVVPRRLLDAENRLGDDATTDNYKFAGQFGGGEEHKVGDITVQGTPKTFARVAAVQDVIAHICNWKTLHPFHYHKKDFSTPEESDATNGRISRQTDSLDFGSVSGQGYMSDPTPVKIMIDHRYGDVDYYRRESFICWHEDGGMQMACGFGANLVMTAGKFRIEAPGNIELVAGSQVIAMGSDVIIEGHNSVDIDAANKDLRLHSKNNMQIASDHVLIEAKGEGSSYDYRNKIGEDVSATGLVFRSRADMVVMGEDVYIRSGVIDGGDIIMDAAKGEGRVVTQSSDMLMFVTASVSIWHGDPEADITETHLFAPGGTVISTPTLMRGSMVLCGENNSLLVSGTIGAGKNIVSVDSMAGGAGGFLAPCPDEFKTKLAEALQKADKSVDEAIAIGGTVREPAIELAWRAPNRPGNDQLISDMTYSHRDDDAEKQFRVTELKFPEPKWQQMVRLGAGSGGTGWQTQPVQYQGRSLYPWPGRKKWTEGQAFIQLKTPFLYEGATGNAKERTAIFETSMTGEQEGVSFSSGLKVIL